MSLPGDLEEGLPASEMSWSGEEEEEEEEAPERNVFLLLGETSQGTIGHQRPLCDRPPSPAPSYESMKSDACFDDDLSDGSEDVPILSHPRIQLEKPDSPVSSCCSMESDASREYPVEPFCMGPRPQVQKPGGSKRSTRWVPLDQAAVKVLLGATEDRHPAMNLPFMLEALRVTLERLEEDDQSDFKKCLVDRYPQIFESSLLEHEIPGLVDKIIEMCDMEGSFKITLLILQHMRLNETATFLQRMYKRNEMQYELKASMKKKYTCMFEGLEEQGSPTLFNKIYTEMEIVGGGDGYVNTEHEIRHIGKMVETKSKEPRVIKSRDIFTPLAGYMKHHRCVLMKGVAGTGKSTCVQRFILDWAEGEGHQDMYFVFPISFRELNSLKSEKFSLIQLIQHFFQEMKELDTISWADEYKVLFIFDGLDECELPLDFFRNEMWCNVDTPTSLDVLLTNLFKGNLIGSAYIWIISRPKASRRISFSCVHRVAEVRGFNDEQKEEYFRKTISDQTLAEQIVTHLQSVRSLYIMCHLPKFCWTASHVFQRAFLKSNGEVPKSLTEVFTRFLLIQLNTKEQKYHRKERRDDKEFLMKVGKLAFQMLEQGKLVLNEEEWEQTKICLEEAAGHSGLCTELIKEEYVLYRENMYCFVHLYIQEYLAALYVFLSFKNHNRNILEKPHGKLQWLFKLTLLDVHKSAVDKALQCPKRNFDMFLRFLLGLSLESNQELLQGIVTKVGGAAHLEKTAQYIKNKMKENHSEESLKNLAHCLTEMQPLHYTA